MDGSGIAYDALLASPSLTDAHTTRPTGRGHGAFP